MHLYIKDLQSKADHAIFSLPLEYLLSPESIDVNDVPGLGPVPVFNHSCKRHPMQIWGLTAQILHVALRTVVGANPAYRDALYGPFMRARRQHAG